MQIRFLTCESTFPPVNPLFIVAALLLTTAGLLCPVFALHVLRCMCVCVWCVVCVVCGVCGVVCGVWCTCSGLLWQSGVRVSMNVVYVVCLCVVCMCMGLYTNVCVVFCVYMMCRCGCGVGMCGCVL